ncbi:MAG: nucleotidyltransferase domain-containing protein [Rhodothermales bacterium]|nr:nucleotidyltransferase domain-containing protein [Rhodothermales bacterium]
MPKREFLIPSEGLDAVCRKWQIADLALFGSAADDTFTYESDVDLLVTFKPEARIGLFEHMKIEEDLEAVFGRRVDLVVRRAVEQSPNWIRRKAILASARMIYAAG